MSDAARVVIVLALVGANAFFVVGEYAVVTARRSTLAVRARRGSAGARVALRLMDDPVRVIATVQVGITAIGILTGAVGERLVSEMVGGGVPGWLGFLIGFAVITSLTVVLGELVPKALTLHRAEALAVVVAPPIRLVSVVLRPVVWVLEASATAILRPFGVRDVVAGGTIRSPEELREIVDQAEVAGVIPRAQEELLHNVFDFPSIEARDVMIPAADVAWLDAGLGVVEALDQLARAFHERYPVGRGSLDRLVGVIHVRAVLGPARHGRAATLGELARHAHVVPETKDLGALLREMREARQQLAVVVDEYGDTAGIVSIEDILEQLVGEIEDEFDLPDSTLTWLDDHTVEVAGSMTIDDFNEAAGVRLPQTDARTLAGLAFSALGRRPKAGDRVQLDQATVRVERVEGLRITRLRVTLPQRWTGDRAP